AIPRHLWHRRVPAPMVRTRSSSTDLLDGDGPGHRGVNLTVIDFDNGTAPLREQSRAPESRERSASRTVRVRCPTNTPRHPWRRMNHSTSFVIACLALSTACGGANMETTGDASDRACRRIDAEDDGFGGVVRKVRIWDD